MVPDQCYQLVNVSVAVVPDFDAEGEVVLLTAHGYRERTNKEQGQAAMHIFIDESGGFQCTDKASAPSCVGAVIIPGRYLQEVEDGFRQLAMGWPTDKGEVKGKLLLERHFVELCQFLETRSVLFECSVIDMACATEEEVNYHRSMQAEGMTKHLTTEHYASLVAEVHRLRGVLEAMPLQLYAQFVTMTHVVWRALEHGMLYYCQRLPGELARFRWVVDAKNDVRITPQEDWWRVCVKPMLQSRSLREPMAMLKGGNYSAFRRNFPSKPTPDYLKEHGFGKERFGNDLGAVFGREMAFADSRDHVGLQIVDALTNCVRRALVGNIQAEGWQPLRKLMIRHREGSVKFITMGAGGSVAERPYSPVAHLLVKGERGMVTSGSRRGDRGARRTARAAG